MADDRFEQDDLWDEKNFPRPDSDKFEDEALELPEPDLSPPDVGGLDPVVEPQQALPPPGLLPASELQQELPQPDMMMPLPGQENAPFPVDSQADQPEAQGNGNQELVAIGERVVEAVEGIPDQLDEIIEKLEKGQGYGP